MSAERDARRDMRGIYTYVVESDGWPERYRRPIPDATDTAPRIAAGLIAAMPEHIGRQWIERGNGNPLHATRAYWLAVSEYEQVVNGLSTTLGD